MIISLDENLLTQTECRYIAHQVNVFGKMGKGLALQIRELFPDTYRDYEKCCKTFKHDWSILKGKIRRSPMDRDGKVFIHCFSQHDWSTDYDAIDMVFEKMSAYQHNVAIPYKFGCGLGGGDWEKVLGIITKYFHNNPNNTNTIYIFKYE